MNKIVVIGGGNGTSTVLRGLRDQAELTAIVSMADSGGSTGTLRRELGVSAGGDARRCLIALSDNADLNKMFEYRFDNGGLEGHNFGNIFLATAEKTTGSFVKGLELAEKILGTKGRVLPVTEANVRLVMNYENAEISGVYEIANTELSAPPELRLEPAARILPEAAQAIAEAEIVVIAPGNLYGSIAPALIVEGMGHALEQTKAKVVYVANMINRDIHTKDYKVHDYAQEIERFIGSPVLDYVIYNDAPVDQTLREGESPVPADKSVLEKAAYKAIPLNATPTSVGTDPKDKIAHIRSLVSYDVKALAEAIQNLPEKQ